MTVTFCCISCENCSCALFPLFPETSRLRSHVLLRSQSEISSPHLVTGTRYQSPEPPATRPVLHVSAPSCAARPSRSESLNGMAAASVLSPRIHPIGHHDPSPAFKWIGRGHFPYSVTVVAPCFRTGRMPVISNASSAASEAEQKDADLTRATPSRTGAQAKCFC